MEAQSFGVLPLGQTHHIDPFDEDAGGSEDILHFNFDSDAEEEEEEIGVLYNNQLATRLNQMGYPIGLCRQAVEKYGNNMEASLRWLSTLLNSSSDSSNPWSSSSNTHNTLADSGSSDILASWSSSAIPGEDGLKEYTYTHNVKNTTKITTNTNSAARSSSGLGNQLNTSLYFSPFSSINNPMDTNTPDPEFYDLSKKVSKLLSFIA